MNTDREGCLIDSLSPANRFGHEGYFTIKRDRRSPSFSRHASPKNNRLKLPSLQALLCVSHCCKFPAPPNARQTSVRDTEAHPCFLIACAQNEDANGLACFLRALIGSWGRRTWGVFKTWQVFRAWSSFPALCWLGKHSKRAAACNKRFLCFRVAQDLVQVGILGGPFRGWCCFCFSWNLHKGQDYCKQMGACPAGYLLKQKLMEKPAVVHPLPPKKVSSCNDLPVAKNATGSSRYSRLAWPFKQPPQSN